MTIMSDALLLSKLPLSATLIANYETGSELVEYQFFYTDKKNEHILVCIERNGKIEEIAFEQLVIPPTLIAKITEEPKPTQVELKKIRQEKITMLTATKTDREQQRAETAARIEQKRADMEAKKLERKAYADACAVSRRQELAELKKLKNEANQLAREEKKAKQIYLAKLKKAIMAIEKAEETGSKKMVETALSLVASLKAA